MSTDWQVSPYYAGDLIHFIWCIGEGQTANRSYPDVKAHWRQQFEPSMPSNLDYLMHWQRASVSKSMLGTLFRYLPVESIAFSGR